MGPGRPLKRGRIDESFFTRTDDGLSGSYLKIKLQSGAPLKSKGWPWVQLGIRQVLGDSEKLEKANFLGDGSLLIKTKSVTQTGKFLHLSKFGNEACDVLKDERLNTSRGTIRAYDLEDLSEEEVVTWLKDFGVVGAKRFTKKVNGRVENTPTLLLTFNRPSCPPKLQFDYVTYHVNVYVPNPLLCFRCGTFGHAEDRCNKAKVCLNCGQSPHDGECTPHCMNCQTPGHSCQSRECSVWLKEKEICKIKVEEEVSYSYARKLYEERHEPPVVRGFAAAVRTPSASNKQEEDDLKGKVDKLEKAVSDMITLLTRLLAKESVDLPVPTAADESSRPDVDQPSTEQTEHQPSSEHKEPQLTDHTTGELPSPGDADRDMDATSAQDSALSQESSSAAPCPSQDRVRFSIGDPMSSQESVPSDTGKQNIPNKKVHDKGNYRQQASTTDDSISPSPVITRATKPYDRAGVPGTRPVTRRRSWVDVSQAS